MNTHSSYLDLFRGFNLRRTEPTVLAYLVRALLAPLVGYIVYFLEKAGLLAAASFDFGMGEYSLAIIEVFIAWAFTPKVGRRTLPLTGTFFMTATTFVIGFIGISDTTKHTNLVYGSILLIHYFVFFITVGPIVYTIVTRDSIQLPAHQERGPSTCMYNINGLIYGQLIPHML
ncbi:putative Major facilitator superfamily (MFS) profile domain-containing protein [Seiridium cardinale]